MAHIVAEPCFDCKYTDCVVVCPVDCFYEGAQMLYIHPDECIDCEACVPECPVEAIFHEDNLPEEWKDFVALNAEQSPKCPVINEKQDALEGKSCDKSRKRIKPPPPKRVRPVVGSSVPKPPKAVQYTITRVVRDTAEARRLKTLYDYRCQICGNRIDLGSDSLYAEVHHLRPLGGGHKGLDNRENMLVLCPTHHAMFDLRLPLFVSDGQVEINGKSHRLTMKHTHTLACGNVDHHNHLVQTARERGGPSGRR
jgi:ferredoxin